MDFVLTPVTPEDHEAAKDRHELEEQAKKEGKPLPVEEPKPKELKEKPITHGLVVRNAKGKVIDLTDGHDMSREYLTQVVRLILGEIAEITVPVAPETPAATDSE